MADLRTEFLFFVFLQLLDLPGIIEGAKDGKGRGKQVIGVARTCNLIVITLDSLKPLGHKLIIEVQNPLSLALLCLICELQIQSLYTLALIVVFVLLSFLQNELEGFGIRLNKEPPNITFKRKDRGGVNFTSTVSKKTQQNLLKPSSKNVLCFASQFCFTVRLICSLSSPSPFLFRPCPFPPVTIGSSHAFRH